MPTLEANMALRDPHEELVKWCRETVAENKHRLDLLSTEGLTAGTAKGDHAAFIAALENQNRIFQGIIDKHEKRESN